MRLRRPFVGLAAAGMAVAAIAQTPTAPPPSLEGLWVGKLRYGPDVRGRLLILPRGNALVADIAGFTLPVRSEGSSLSFELPDGKGSFRGVRDKATIMGNGSRR